MLSRGIDAPARLAECTPATLDADQGGSIDDEQSGLIHLRCVGVVNGRTATGLAPVPGQLWDEISEDEREKFCDVARREFQRAARVQLGVELADEEVHGLRVVRATDPVDPIPVVR